MNEQFGGLKRPQVPGLPLSVVIVLEIDSGVCYCTPALVHQFLKAGSILYIRVNPTDSLPIYIQIINQVKGLVAAGKLLADEPIPSVRQLAVDLAVNPNTVARAYLELEHEGITYKRRGQGTFISTDAVVLCKDHTITTLNDLLEEAVREGMRFGLTEDQLRRAFDEVCNKVTATMDGEPSQST